MKLKETPLLPATPESAYDTDLQRALMPLLRDMAIKVNQLAAGRFVGIDDAATAAPTTGRWQQGDQVRNSNPTELGAAGSRYVLIGWICVAGGSPGTWREMRTLTGT
jgi:hypothetical protein